MAGRPKKELTPGELEKLVAMGCTDVEIAAWFSCNVRTIERKRQEPEYKEIFDNARAVTHVSLRRAQLQAALKGNTSMLIWLGKTMLGQKESVALQHSGTIGEIEEDDKAIAARFAAKMNAEA